jgi:tyrosine-protein kinase Etk/Wzc
MTPDSDERPRSNVIRSHSIKSEHVERAVPELARDGSTNDLRSYFNFLFDNRWLIGVVSLVATLAGMLYAFSAKPVYESNMTIHVEETSPNATKNALSEASSLFETKKPAIAEMELLRSRMVIAPAIDKLRLDIDVRPKYFPIARFWSADADANELSTPGIFGYGGYVWGAERIEVAVFNVPEHMLNRALVITAQGNNRYRLKDETRHRAWDGIVGTTLTARSTDGDIELRVERLDAKPGAKFLLRRLSKQRVMATIQNALSTSEQGKQSGVIQVTLQGESPTLVRNALNEIGREYLRQNLARKTEEAEKSLAFLNMQLPALKLELERAEAEYNQFRNRHGTINLAEEARISLAHSAAASNKRAEVLQRRNELLTRLGDQHPTIVGINKQLQDIDAEISGASDHIRTLPQMEQDELRLARNIKVNTDLYTGLSNTAQQLRLLAGSKVSNVRMVDAPTKPESPVTPNRPLIISSAVLMGLLLGTVGAFARKALSGRIDTPKAIEKMLGGRVVHATIPHSTYQQQLARQSVDDSRRIPMLAKVSPGDPAIEALRSFRAALQFAMPMFRNNIVMLTGPTPRLGKSFVSANAATVIAAGGKKVLLIDMDLRNGHLHRYFGTEKQNGLYESVTGAARVDQIVRHGVMDNLDFIPTGAWTPDHPEFLTHRGFGAWLKAVSARYDLVLIDAPPVLAAADALIIGEHAGAVFILARAGITTEDEINESVRRLNQAGISPEGIVFNDAKVRRGVYQYQYEYQQPRRLGWKSPS